MSDIYKVKKIKMFFQATGFEFDTYVIEKDIKSFPHIDKHNRLWLTKKLFIYDKEVNTISDFWIIRPYFKKKAKCNDEQNILYNRYIKAKKLMNQ